MAYSYIEDMENAKFGLEEDVTALEDDLTDPNLDTEVRKFLEDKVGETKKVIERMGRALNGQP